MADRPVCDGCGRPMPLTDAESRALQAREFAEFEDVRYPNSKGRPKAAPGTPVDGEPT